MSDPKGKGRADPSKEAEAPSPSTITTLISNVASSASGLARSALAAPSQSELNKAASSAIAGAGKAQSSSGSAGSSAWAESSKHATGGASQANSAAQSPQPQGMRNHQAAHVASAEAEFSSFLDSVPAMSSDLPAMGQNSIPPQPARRSPVMYTDLKEYQNALLKLEKQNKAKLLAAQRDHQNRIDAEINLLADAGTVDGAGAGSVKQGTQNEDTSPRNTILASPEPATTSYTTVAEAQAHDGLDVVNILSTLSPQELDYFEPQSIEDEIAEWNLSPSQISLMKRLSSELHKSPDSENPWNMIPEAFQTRDKEQWLPEEYAQDSHSHLGSVLPAHEAKSSWVEQWEDVLNRYQDEVWGGMLPLVKEAKEELKEIVQGSESQQPKALRRLDMVLNHIAQRPVSATEAQQGVPSQAVSGAEFGKALADRRDGEL